MNSIILYYDKKTNTHNNTYWNNLRGVGIILQYLYGSPVYP